MEKPVSFHRRVGWRAAAGAITVAIAGCGTTGGAVDDSPVQLVTGYETPSGGGLPAARERAEAGDVPGAIEIARAHIQAEPADPVGYYTLGTLLSMRNERAAAREALEKCVELDPRHGPAHNNLGLLALEERRYDEATAAFARAAELMPHDVEPLINLGAARLSNGAFAASVAAYEDALVRSPGNNAARLGLANAMSSLARYDEAVDEYEKLLRSEEGLVDAHVGLATVYRHTLDLKKARFHADQALRLEPENPMGLLASARIREAANQPKEAEAFYAKALEHAPHHLDVLYNYGVFLEDQKRRAEAVALFSQYLELAQPDEIHTRHVRQRLERLQKPDPEPAPPPGANP